MTKEFAYISTIFAQYFRSVVPATIECCWCMYCSLHDVLVDLSWKHAACLQLVGHSVKIRRVGVAKRATARGMSQRGQVARTKNRKTAICIIQSNEDNAIIQSSIPWACLMVYAGPDHAVARARPHRDRLANQKQLSSLPVGGYSLQFLR